MKAIVQDRYGNADVMKYQDIVRPEPRKGEVLLRIRAAGLDPGVWHIMTGIPYVMRLGTGLRAPRMRLGGDVAGDVAAVGPGVTGFEVGDPVFGTCDGSFAEYARARQDWIVPMPGNVTYTQAAAVPTSGTTALQALRGTGKGDKVLVVGAGGGVGTFAVRLATLLGAEVTGVCGPSKADLVRSLGAHHVIDYTREDFAEGPARYDLVLVLAGDRPLSHLRRALTRRGQAIIIGGEEGGRWLAGLERGLLAVLLRPFLRHRKPGFLLSTRKLGDLRRLAELLASGELTPAVGATYSLSEAPEAMRRLAEGHTSGKTVITVP